jgi:uncharacterized membrane protein YbhN (UPF0104 family)
MERSSTATDHARRLRNGLISLAILVVIVVGLVLAVPGLHGVGETVADMSPAWIAGAVGLEILSCAGFVLIFVTVFDRTPFAFGARVALTEMAFGAAVSLGGAGSIAVGAWLMIERGIPSGHVAQRSAVLFLLTSAINVFTLALFGVLLGLGVLPGPTNPLLTLVPAGVAVAMFLFFLGVPRMAERAARVRSGGRVAALLEGTASSIRDAVELLRHPSWRLAGAVAYLWCDIAVLWACFEATGHTPPIAVIVLAYQIGYLANVLPIPGNIGVLEGSFVGMLVLYHVHATAATAAAVVYHAIALWIPALWGTWAFLRLRHAARDPLVLRPPLSERGASGRRSP